MFSDKSAKMNEQDGLSNLYYSLNTNITDSMSWAHGVLDRNVGGKTLSRTSRASYLVLIDSFCPAVILSCNLKFYDRNSIQTYFGGKNYSKPSTALSLCEVRDDRNMTLSIEDSLFKYGC